MADVEMVNVGIEEIETNDDADSLLEAPPEKVLRSSVWVYFRKTGTKQNPLAECLLWPNKKTIKISQGSTTALRRHIGLHQKNSTSMDKSSQPVAIQPLPRDSRRSQKITWAVEYVICQDQQPYSIVEDSGFKHLLKTLEPRYQLPSHLTEIRTLIFTIDSWTSRATVGYLSLTLHYLSENFVLQNLSFGIQLISGAHTGDNIHEHLINILTEWGIDFYGRDRVIWVTDNGKNIKKAVSKEPEWSRLSYFAHTLQLCVNDCKSSIPTLSTLIEQCSSVVGHFARSSKSSETFDDYQRRLTEKEPLCLIQHVRTRWDSCYDMFEWLEHLRVPLEGVWNQLKTIPRLTSSDFDDIHSYIQLFKPIKEATKTMSGEKYCTVAKIIPIVTLLKETLENEQFCLTGTYGDDVSELHRSVCYRLKEYLDNDMLWLAMILNPKIKYKLFKEHQIQEQTRIREVMENYINTSFNTPGNNITHRRQDDNLMGFEKMIAEKVSEAEGQINSEEHDFRMELQRYLETPCIGLRDTSSERCFSHAGQIVSSNRARLSTENAEILTFLYENWEL
ncbi:hypothetical protein TKK_0015365 [Trichogramma kaykai]